MRFPRTRTILIGCALAATTATPAVVPDAHPAATATPIQHLIVIIGENETFDGLFATYAPRTGSVRNLLSEGIITADGAPGPNFGRARQQQAAAQTRYTLDPQRVAPYPVLPHPRLVGVQNRNLQLVGTGNDLRFPGTLPPGPFQTTHFVPYPVTDLVPTFGTADAALSAATGDPVHRFFQMWQQTGGDNAQARPVHVGGRHGRQGRRHHRSDGRGSRPGRGADGLCEHAARGRELSAQPRRPLRPE